jgi:hypothetical protein
MAPTLTSPMNQVSGSLCAVVTWRLHRPTHRRRGTVLWVWTMPPMAQECFEENRQMMRMGREMRRMRNRCDGADGRPSARRREY